MGLPLLVLSAAPSVAVIAGVIAVFVVGEMLWIPTSQAVAARLAPAPARHLLRRAVGDDRARLDVRAFWRCSSRRVGPGGGLDDVRGRLPGGAAAVAEAVRKTRDE